MAMEGLQEDSGDGVVQCADHPYKNNAPGGICAFCLQEKLGKLVSSSFPIAVFPSNSSSPSSPSFRSDQFTTTTTTATSAIVAIRTNPSNLSNTHNHNLSNNYQFNHFRKYRIHFLLTQKKKKKKELSSASDHTNRIIFKRSKSSATPRRGVHLVEANEIDDFSPHKRRFWSFLYSSKHHTTKKLPDVKEICYPSSSSSSSTANIGSLSQQRSRERKKEEFVVVEENESTGQVSFDRKVSRSRSVGCGSRSFSGDFFERISTGFGDCTLRRVESQREGKSRVRQGGGGSGGQDCIKERVKCGGLFSGFMITSSSSSSSSSSNWVSSSTEDNNNNNVNAKPSAGAGATTVARQLAHGRSKSWGWTLASPMRAFSKPSSAKRGPAATAANKNGAPNLAAIPSLLAVRS